MFRKTSFLPYLCSFLFVLISLQAVYSRNPPTQTQITSLELNKTIEREIAGGEKHEFKITFTAAARFAGLSVRQNGIDVVVRLIGGGGDTVIEFDSEPRNQGNEPVEVFSADAGNLILSVEPKQKSARAGRYEILWSEQHEATDREIALDEARKLQTQANNLWRIGKYSEALPLAERLLSIRERELGADHPDFGQAVFTLGNIVGDLGDLDKCEALYARAFEIKEKALGSDHLSLAVILNNWAVIYSMKGDYVKAETLHRRVLEIREKTLEPNHLLIAVSLNNIAGIIRVKGDNEQAAILYRRALTIREKALGEEHPDVATSLNNLANLYDDFAVAEPLYKRALAIREKIFGSEHQDVAQSLYNLARIYAVEGDFPKAELFCERALKIFEKTLGAQHIFISYPINLLAVIYKNTDKYDKAESFYLRAAALKEKTQGLFHPELGGTYANLANLYAIKGETEKAIAAQTRANEILEYNTALNLTVGSEREKLDYLKTLTEIEDQTLTLNFKTAPDSAAAARLAAESILQRKGRVLDAMADSIGLLRRRFDRQDRILLDNLNEANKQLVSFISEGGENASSADEYRQKIKTLEQQREAVENQISRRSAGFYESSKSVSLEDLKGVIPEKAALIEFAVYSPISHKLFEFGKTEEKARTDPEKSVRDPRYGVFVINSKGEVKSRDLGSAREIEAVIESFRQSLRDPKRKDTQKNARAADEKIMQPVRALLAPGEAQHLLVSPDGALNLIPFEALIDEQSRYLIERYSFTYLSSGRDLLRMKIPRESKSKTLIFANPSFGEPVAPPDSRRVKKPNGIAARDLSETYFAPLGGTLQEARSIQTLFPEASLLTGTQATEALLKQTSAPRLLHIATHGFFLEDRLELSKDANSRIENPLLRSGLALTGANRRSGGGGSGGDQEDGILTALEASGLNLWGTKLVVLSACDTGLGEVRNGEGVYGLRRAFTLAGTQSLVMSLWSVSDYITRDLMTNYYKHLKQGAGRGESLRRVQLEMLKREDRRHPFYWASFIQSGEWANLDGKR